MKKSRLWLIVLMAFFMSGTAVPMVLAVTYDALPVQATGIADEKMETAYLQDITFEKLPGKERIILAFSKESGVMIESKNSHSVVAIMANTYIPEDFRRSIGDGKLDNLYNITASQQDKDGQPWGYVTMEMRERVPYMVRKDGSNILIDFNVAGLAGKPNRQTSTTLVKRQKESTSAKNMPAVAPGESRPANAGKADLEKLITIDFQEANIKSVLRLLAEEGGVSIVSGDDVKGNVTLSVKRVTWNVAFETVLAVHSLGRVMEGEVYIVKTVDRMRKEEKTKADEAADRIKRQKAQEIADQEKRVNDGRLPQISIEAKIVEVSRSGSRQLGILWGGGYKGKIGDKDVGIIGGNSPFVEGSTTSTVLKTDTSGDVGLAVNFPSATSAANPALGIILSSAHMLLAAKLEALETSGDGKIISSPRVTTLDNESALIGQGEEIPYVTRDKDGTPTIVMKDAKLSLTVKPKLTSEGKIAMEIKCDQKTADWKKVNKNNENPPLVASNVESKVVVKDGDTIVLGGIMKTMVTKSNTGVPWLSKIPALGWLFKSVGDETEERELLIFVTPRIVKET
jgi:type IV pilus assembly protein PilQ